MLRFVGILNAAVWCGSAIFLTIALPAIFSPELKKAFSAPGVGFVAQAVVARFFILQYCCGTIALAHLAAQWLYGGHPPLRWNLRLVIALLSLALAGGLWAQPKMQNLHREKYFGRTVARQAEAARSFALWHGVSEAVNVLVIGGLVVYLWRVSAPTEHARFGNIGKIRG
ncbi:MAG: DUF4149 domain-containing protein [Verrucomicrobiota bacterium]|jgi:hypothetical protein